MTIRAYEIVWSGVLAGQFVQTVQHLIADEPSDNGAFVTAREIVSITNFDAMNDAFMGMLPAPYTLTSVRCRRVFPEGGPTAITLGPLFSTTTGLRVGEISSAQVNPVILWIGETDEADLGKLFVPGVSETDIGNMALVAGLVGDIVAFIDEWIAGIAISAVQYQGAIAKRASVSPYNVISAREISYGQVSPMIGTQRRRLRPV